MLALYFCFLSSLVGVGVLANVQLDSYNVDQTKYSTSGSLSQRMKRNYAGIQAGRAALKFILDGAEHLQAFGDVSLYTKRGGYRAALRDFKAVHPKAVEVVHDVNGIIRTSGMVGNKRIIVEKGRGTKSTSLRITKNCCEFNKKQSKLDYNVVIYKDS